MTLDLRTTAREALRVVAGAAEQSGNAVEAVTELSHLGDAPPEPGETDRDQSSTPMGYRLLARREDRARSGPLLTVFEIMEAGGGVTRVRIVQSGFADERAWQELAQHWNGRPTPPSSDRTEFQRHPRMNRRLDPFSRDWRRPPSEPDAAWSWPPAPPPPTRPPGLHDWLLSVLVPPARGANNSGASFTRGVADGADPRLVAQVVSALRELAVPAGRSGQSGPAAPAGRVRGRGR